MPDFDELEELFSLKADAARAAGEAQARYLALPPGPLRDEAQGEAAWLAADAAAVQ